MKKKTDDEILAELREIRGLCVANTTQLMRLTLAVAKLQLEPND